MGEQIDFESIVTREMAELKETVHRLEAAPQAVSAMARAIVEALKAGKKVLCAGNGGSASDALHMAEELVGRYRSDRVPLPAIALVADTTAITCIGNDFGFDHIFSRQVTALGQEGDILVLFSTSGNSENLIQAAAAAKAKGLRILGFLGKDGGRLAKESDLAWIVPSKNTARIQELHTWGLHTILETVEIAFPV